MLIKKMDFSRMMGHAKHIEEGKLKEKEMGNKSTRISSFNFSEKTSNSWNHS